MKTQKKVFAENWGVFSSKLGEDQNKKQKQKKGLRCNLGLYSARNLGLFLQANSFSSDHPALNSRWRDA